MSKQKSAMHNGMSNSYGLGVRCYATFMIGINEYFSVFPEPKASGKM